MSNRTLHLSRLRLGVVVATAAAVFALSGCAGADQPAEPDAPAPAATEAPAPEPSPTETAAASGGSAAPSSASFGSCDTLLPAEVVATLDAGLAADASFTPATGSYAAEIVSYGGIGCSWTDASTGNTLTLAVAQPPTDDLTTAETALGGGAGTATDAFGSGIQAYTANGGGTFTGDIEVFTPAGYWVSTVPPLFTSAEAAQPIVSAVLQALPAG